MRSCIARRRREGCSSDGGPPQCTFPPNPAKQAVREYRLLRMLSRSVPDNRWLNSRGSSARPWSKRFPKALASTSALRHDSTSYLRAGRERLSSLWLSGCPDRSFTAQSSLPFSDQWVRIILPVKECSHLHALDVPQAGMPPASTVLRRHLARRLVQTFLLIPACMHTLAGTS